MGLTGGRREQASSLFGLAGHEASVPLFLLSSPLAAGTVRHTVRQFRWLARPSGPVPSALALGGLGCRHLHLACSSLARLCDKGLPI